MHNVIYELIEEVQDAMVGLLAPEIKEKITAHAEIKQVFLMGKGGKVAGCLVTHGTVRPALKVHVKRGDEILYDGTMMSLKHFQDHVTEVREAAECGIRLDNFTDFQEGDILEFYETEEVKQTL